MPDALWEIPKPDFILQSTLARALGISPVTAQVLINRGIRTAEEAKVFLRGGIEALSSPYALPDMEVALERICRAIRRREKVLIYGDYDVDGLSAAALLGEMLAQGGLEVEFYIPHRLEEGYGLSIAGLSYGLMQGCSLVITVDCGITAVQEAAWAREQGLDLIITDHHRPGEHLPPAIALVNPWMGFWQGPNPAGAGVAFKLVQGLAAELGWGGEEGSGAYRTLDLVALGTIADAVPLLGENRILVREGLKRLQGALRPGVKALLEVAGLKAEELTAERVAFVLAPRLNAAGRLGSARPALDLLLTSSPQEAWDLAQMLNQENCARQLLEEHILSEALVQAEAAVERGDPGLVVAGTGWHPGVLGIVAGKLAERFRRPAVVIALDPEGRGRGSGRSIMGIDLFRVLQSCQQHLLSWGGHGQAVGLEITAERVAPFREAFLAHLEVACGEAEVRPRLALEAEVLFSQLDEQLVEELETLAPFGEEHPRPLLLYRGARVVSAQQVGSQGQHLKLYVQAEGRELPAIGFRMTLPESVAVGSRVDLAFRPALNTYNGREQLELILAALRPAETSITAQEIRLLAGGELEESEPVEDTRRATWAGTILGELKHHLDCRRGAVKVVFASGRGVLACYHGLRDMLFSEEIGLWARGPWLSREKPSRTLLTATVVLQPLEFILEEEETDAYCELWSPEAASVPPQGKVLDFGREANITGVLPDPLSYAVKMAAMGKRILIYTPDRKEAGRLIQILEQRSTGKVLLAEGLSPEQKALIYYGCRVGEFPLVVGIGSRPAWYYPAEVIIFTYLPQGREEMELAIPPVSKRPEVYLSAHALAKGPPAAQVHGLRPFLGRLYKRLQALARGGKEVYLHKQITGQYLLQCSLNILEELGLIECREVGQGLRIRLSSPAPEKQDLNKSWRYRQLCRDYEAVWSLWRELTEGLRG
ncbi:MAG: single-stranded-DNA-specific exonuclease RecJ [Moorellaceae bacterium]